MSRLHLFDMDGTLLPGTTASLLIAHHLGCLPRLTELEDAYAHGSIDTRDFAAHICRLWYALTPADVAEVFTRAPWINGMADVFADIHRRGEHTAVITLSPDFFAHHLTSFGVVTIAASRFPPLPFRTPPDPTDILTPADKITAAARISADLGLKLDECIAYGDSHSDIPLFQRLAHTVAINAHHSLRAISSAHYDGTNLQAAYGTARARFIDTR
jgi:phosphoserine phosphatase